ncbi:hypothetical protein [Catenuloplanes japonicus]|uniref:hypothetical protein n=1 Tax=Catenuloplanes japonicus TaxID=33876 RepID=UPI00068EFDF0|nr:hypothetical protein [Catenuloplanes japonicus]
MGVRPEPRILDSRVARAAAMLHRLLTTGLWTLTACSPTVAAGLALGGDVSNLPLLAVAALPVGPGVAAALSCLHAHRPDLADLHPSADYLRAWRALASVSLRLWAPFLALLTVLAINLTHLDVAGVPGWWAVPLTLIAVAACLWAAVALTLTALSPDAPASVVARRAAYQLMCRPGLSLVTAVLLIVAAGLTLAWSEAALLIASPVLLLALLRSVSFLGETA